MNTNKTVSLELQEMGAEEFCKHYQFPFYPEFTNADLITLGINQRIQQKIMELVMDLSPNLRDAKNEYEVEEGERTICESDYLIKNKNYKIKINIAFTPHED